MAGDACHVFSSYLFILFLKSQPHEPDRGVAITVTMLIKTALVHTL